MQQRTLCNAEAEALPNTLSERITGNHGSDRRTSAENALGWTFSRGNATRVTNRLPVKASDNLGRLQLVDLEDKPCVIFRQWHVRPLGNRPSRSADRNSGCDLIVRSDIWKTIGNLYAN